MTVPDPVLSIIVPAYNEADRLPESLPTLRSYADRTGQDVEVLVVDDGSCDGTIQVVHEFSARWPALRLVALQRHRGKGAAVRAGFEASRGAVVAFVDADLSAPVGQLDELISDLATADVAILSRALPGAQLLRRQSRLRETMGRLYSKVARVLVLRGVPDAHCGLKAFRGDMARALANELREDGVLFDLEALLLVTRWGGRISQRPSVWSHHPDSRLHLGPKALWSIAFALLRIKIARRVLWPPRARSPLEYAER